MSTIIARSAASDETDKDVDEETAAFLGLISTLHNQNVPLNRLPQMVSSHGDVHPIMEEEAALETGLGAYYTAIERKLSNRSALDWGAIQRHVAYLQGRKSADGKRRHEDAAQTTRWWNDMHFIDIPAGELPAIDDNAGVLKNDVPFKIMTTPVTEGMYFDALGTWPAAIKDWRYACPAYEADGGLHHPDAPIGQVGFNADLTSHGRADGRLLIAMLNQQHHGRGYLYDVPTMAERQFVLGLTIHQLQKKFPKLFWPINDPETTQIGNYATCYPDISSTMFAVKQRLALHIGDQPIWDLFGLINEWIYDPILKTSGGAGTRGGFQLRMEQEDRAIKEPYRFWTTLLRAINGRAYNSIYPRTVMGLRLVQRPNGTELHYKNLDL